MPEHCRVLDRVLVTESNLASVRGEIPCPLRGLQRLRLHGATVCGPGLRHLRELPLLRELDLRASRVIGAAVPHLAALPSLQRLLILARQLSEADAERLRRLAGRPIDVVRQEGFAPSP